MDDYSRGVMAGTAAGLELAADLVRSGHPFTADELERLADRQRHALRAELRAALDAIRDESPEYGELPAARRARAGQSPCDS